MITYTFTRDQLVEAFAKWETDSRAGLTMSEEEAAALFVYERAEQSAAAFTEYLAAIERVDPPV